MLLTVWERLPVKAKKDIKLKSCDDYLNSSPIPVCCPMCLRNKARYLIDSTTSLTHFERKQYPVRFLSACI